MFLQAGIQWHCWLSSGIWVPSWQMPMVVANQFRQALSVGERGPEMFVPS